MPSFCFTHIVVALSAAVAIDAEMIVARRSKRVTQNRKRTCGRVQTGTPRADYNIISISKRSRTSPPMVTCSRFRATKPKAETAGSAVTLAWTHSSGRPFARARSRMRLNNSRKQTCAPRFGSDIGKIDVASLRQAHEAEQSAIRFCDAPKARASLSPYARKAPPRPQA